MESTYTAAFVNANKAMHKANFDDSLSGTTAITVFVKGDTLYVANVGDSRAIIARETDDGKLRYHPLSVDQTPFRKDERERLKKKVLFLPPLPLDSFWSFLTMPPPPPHRAPGS
jgi:serine/threonine protein phosphatase PrpC